MRSRRGHTTACVEDPGSACICISAHAGAAGVTFETPMPTADYTVKPALRRPDGVVDVRAGLSIPLRGDELRRRLRDLAAELVMKSTQCRADFTELRTWERAGRGGAPYAPGQVSAEDKLPRALRQPETSDRAAALDLFAAELRMIADHLEDARLYELSLADLRTLGLLNPVSL